MTTQLTNEGLVDDIQAMLAARGESESHDDALGPFTRAEITAFRKGAGDAAAWPIGHKGQRDLLLRFLATLDGERAARALLAAELDQTAEWLDERSAALLRMPGATAAQTRIAEETARLRGRAVLIRTVLAKAKD